MADRVLKTLRPEGAKPRQLLRKLGRRFMALKSGILKNMLLLVSEEFITLFEHFWLWRARSDQLPPQDESWLIWLLLGGRGSGKTRAGAEWVLDRVRQGAKRIALVAPTYHDARSVMVEGESGLLNIGPSDERPTFYPSRRRLEWPNGAVAQIFSAQDPDGLRGPQFDTGWADEFCAWEYPDATLSNLRLALRLKMPDDHPRLTITTTPRPISALKALMTTPRNHITRMKSRDNIDNLAPGFIEALEDVYAGTRLGRQEMDGELIESLPGALWSRDMIEAACAKPHAYTPASRQEYEKVVIAIDPPASAHKNSDACGIIVAGRPRGSDKAVLIHDGTVQGVSPDKWAPQVKWLAEFYKADLIIAEINQGGNMVKSILREALGHDMPIKTVRAAKSKSERAAPIAHFYEQGRVTHLARFSALEDELCQLGTDVKSAKSPDRADALIWALTELLSAPRFWPRIRILR